MRQQVGFNFKYRLVDDWPPLAWLAVCRRGEGSLLVVHGSAVEVRERWFCEAVWDGDYETGGFDYSDLVFGSGGRLRGQHATFVASSTTVDRLHVFRDETSALVSNSLACALGALKASLDLNYRGWFNDLGSIVKGLDNYKRELVSSRGLIELVYFNNVEWNGWQLVEVAKHEPLRDFGSFLKYHDFLTSSMGQIANNLRCPSRARPYELLGTLSSGYDSPTIAVLARQHGLQEALSFESARGGGSDDGRVVAEVVGISLVMVPRDAWRQRSLPEVLFLASDAKGEDVYFAGAEDYLRGRVLLTGFHGDKVWAKENESVGAGMTRGDRSGLSLSEYRLWVGFVHLPVPFMGARQARDINAISNSPELAPWDTGGGYSRPICRRIVEEAGVPREAFGQRKKAASVLFQNRCDSLTPRTRERHNEWLRLEVGRSTRPNALERAVIRAVARSIMTGLDASARALRRLARAAPAASSAPAERAATFLEATRRAAVRRLFSRTEWLSAIFVWAIEETKRGYRQMPAVVSGDQSGAASGRAP